MEAIFGGMPHCKRCKVELSGTEHVCPKCDFAPRQIGLWLAGVGMLVMVGSMIIAQLSATVNPRVGMYFMGLGVLGFAFALTTFLLAMVATPYRLGRLFDLF